MRLIRSRKSGFALIEAMTALSVLMMGLMGVMSITSWSLSVNRVIADQYIASYLAAEGIEVVKNLIDANVIQGNPWDAGVNNGRYALDYGTLLAAAPPPCTPRPRELCPLGQRRNLFFDLNSGTYVFNNNGPPPQPPTHKFERVVEVDKISADEMRVIATVSWESRGGGSHSVVIHDHFFNWRP